jgi:hypothetical protein
MQTLRCGALLDVAHVTLERLREVAHRAQAVGPCEDPGEHDAAECRVMRRPGILVGDRSRNHVVIQPIAKARKYLAELIG